MQSSIAWYRRLLEVEEGAESLLFLPSEACELTTSIYFSTKSNYPLFSNGTLKVSYLL